MYNKIMWPHEKYIQMYKNMFSDGKMNVNGQELYRELQLRWPSLSSNGKTVTLANKITPII